MDKNRAKFEIVLLQVTKMYMIVATIEVLMMAYGIWEQVPMQVSGLMIALVMAYLGGVQATFDGIAERIPELQRVWNERA